MSDNDEIAERMIAKRMKELQEEANKQNSQQVPWGGQVGGTCGKCGAPYTFDAFGRIVPICACWNLPKVKTTTNTGEI